MEGLLGHLKPEDIPMLIWSAVVVLILLLGAGYLICLWLWHPSRMLKRKVKKMGAKVLSNLHLPDGVDGEINIDYLVLTEKGMLIIDVKRYDGLIYGSETHDEWTQVLKHRSYMFANPLKQMNMRVLAVKFIVPEAHIEGAVLFAGRGRFPKRTPTGIITLEGITKHSTKINVTEQAKADWKRLSDFQRSHLSH